MLQKTWKALALHGLILASLFGGVAHAASEWDTAILSQGGSTVTLGDVDAFLQRMPAERRVGFLDSSKRINQMLINILRNKQLQQQAIDMKLDQDPQIKADIAFETMMVLSVKRMEAFEKSLAIPPLGAAAKEEYLAHKADYMTPANIEVQHILIGAKEHSDEEGKALADKVRAEAAANPTGFDALVAQYSDDPTKGQNKGHISDASSDSFVTPFREAAKSLTKINEVSPVVKTSFGYHILKLVKSTPPKQIEFTAVKDKIEAKLKDNYITDKRQAYLAKFDEGTPEVNPDVMDILQKKYMQGVVTPTEAAQAVKQAAQQPAAPAQKQ